MVPHRPPHQCARVPSSADHSYPAESQGLSATPLLCCCRSRTSWPLPRPPTPKNDLAPSLSPCAGSLFQGTAYRTQCQTDQLAASLVPRNARPYIRLPVCPVCHGPLRYHHLISSPEQSPLHSRPRTAHQPSPEPHPHFLDGISSPVNRLDAYRVLDCSCARDRDCASPTLTD